MLLLHLLDLVSRLHLSLLLLLVLDEVLPSLPDLLVSLPCPLLRVRGLGWKNSPAAQSRRVDLVSTSCRKRRRSMGLN